MTEERRQVLEQEREAAAAAHDEARLAAIERTIAREMLECQAHMGTRVKEILKVVEELATKVDAISDKLNTATAKKEGAVWALKIVKYLATFLGGAGLVKLLAALPT